ncbi:hypothetical protein HPB51_023421 [Rhipicephalus microplus]|uniref:Uncharacterized protein n=1 Tax=Rhipicephalus microplus TaxID=6941 RepID=A0A9J6DK92_RHIMP|nr:hypothetical protein HPB51_023421 [Rhipicephalus microplus]
MEDTFTVTAAMDVDSPGLPPQPSTSSAATTRKRTGHPSDSDSENTLIYSTASDESSNKCDFVPVTRRQRKRRLVMPSPTTSKNVTPTREYTIYTILFLPVDAAHSLNRLSRQVTSKSLEGEIAGVWINGRKIILAVDVTQRSTLVLLSNVKMLDNINVPSYIADGRESKAGVIYDVDISISESDFAAFIEPVSAELTVLQVGHCPIRRRRSRRRRPLRRPSAEARIEPYQKTAGIPPQAPRHADNKFSKQDKSITGSPKEWPELPTIDPPFEPPHRSSTITSERECGDSRDKEIVAMVKALMNTIHMLLSSIDSPAAKSALQLVDALKPVLSSLERHHGSASESLS